VAAMNENVSTVTGALPSAFIGKRSNKSSRKRVAFGPQRAGTGRRAGGGFGRSARSFRAARQTVEGQIQDRSGEQLACLHQQTIIPSLAAYCNR
jgi:hypothetical protein